MTILHTLSGDDVLITKCPGDGTMIRAISRIRDSHGSNNTWSRVRALLWSRRISSFSTQPIVVINLSGGTIAGSLVRTLARNHEH